MPIVAVENIVLIKDLHLVDNTRKVKGGPKFDELVASIRSQGVLVPVLIREEGTGKDSKRILIAGHRRRAAALKVGLNSLPFRLVKVNETEAEDIQVIENLQREDLNPLEEAEAFRRLMSRDSTIPVFTHQGQKRMPAELFKKQLIKVAKLVGKSSSFIERSVRLTELPAKVKGWIAADKLEIDHGLIFLTIAKSQQDKALEYLKSEVEGVDAGSENEVASIQSFQSWVDSNTKKDLAEARFPTGIKFNDVLACVVCPNNTGTQGQLLGTDIGALGTCTDNKCWKQKKDKVWKDVRDKVMTSHPFGSEMKFGGFGNELRCGGHYGASRLTAIKRKPIMDVPAKSNPLFERIKAHQNWFRMGILKRGEFKKIGTHPEHKVVMMVINPEGVKGIKGVKAKLEDQSEERHGDPTRATFIRDLESAPFVDMVTAAAKKLPLKVKDPAKILRFFTNGNMSSVWGDAKSCLMKFFDVKKAKDLEKAIGKASFEDYVRALVLITEVDDNANLGILDLEIKETKKKITNVLTKMYETHKASITIKNNALNIEDKAFTVIEKELSEKLKV